jgi:glycosyltransferase involved in cell wall biosynthesis
LQGSGDLRIAVISECFLTGGLETRTKGLMRHVISKGHEVSLIVQHFDSKANASASFKNIHIVNFNSIETVRKALLDINPDIADIHPFESLISGSSACIELGIPYTATVHGPYLNAKYIRALDNAKCVFTVSEEVADQISEMVATAKVVLLRNGIDTNRFKPVKHGSQKRIAIISRLDHDKTAGITSLLNLLQSTGVAIDIIGKGKAENQLRQHCKSYNFLGHIDDIAGYFQANSDRYSFISGMGRVAIEGMAMEMPMLLLGYDGAKGFITPENFSSLAARNFSGRNMTNAYTDNPAKIFEDCERVKPFVRALRNMVLVEHDEKKIATLYLKQIGG